MMGRSLALIVLGLVAPLPIQSVGVLFIGEVLVAVIAAWAALTNFALFGKNRVLVTLGLALLVTFLGYAITDVAKENSLTNVARGWGRLIFLGTNIAGLWFLLGTSTTAVWTRRLATFCGAYAVGRCLSTLTSGREYDIWKFGYGIPVTVLVCCLIAHSAIPARLRAVAPMLGLLCLTHVYLDFRSCAGYLAIILCTILGQAFPNAISRGFAFATIALVVFSFLILSFAFQTDLVSRRSASGTFRASGYATAVRAIMDSPLLGHGSWSSSSEFQDQFIGMIRAEGHAVGYDPNLRFEAHSQIVQAWFEGGILGVTFFAVLALYLCRALYYCVSSRVLDPPMCLLMFLLLDSTWNVFLGPFAGNQRLDLALAIVVAARLFAERVTIIGQRGRPLRLHVTLTSDSIVTSTKLQAMKFVDLNT